MDILLWKVTCETFASLNIRGADVSSAIYAPASLSKTNAGEGRHGPRFRLSSWMTAAPAGPTLPRLPDVLAIVDVKNEFAGPGIRGVQFGFLRLLPCK
jgi:hypothetical protein